MTGKRAALDHAHETKTGQNVTKIALKLAAVQSLFVIAPCAVHQS